MSFNTYPRRTAYRPSSNETKKKKTDWISTAIGALIIIAIVELIWPNVIPFKLFEFWTLKKPLWEAITLSWPLLVWAIAINILAAATHRNKPEINRDAEDILLKGVKISVRAGVLEEIIFRWVLFYYQIIGYKIANWIFFGFAGFGVFEWLYLHITGPVANFATFGHLEPILFNGFGWAVGAAILSSNGRFRDGHSYQGLLGWINAWFCGMFFFYLMFNYGLVASITVHILFDLFVFAVIYVDAAIERALGWD